MQTAKQIGQQLIALVGMLGVVLLTSCESSTGDITLVAVVNQTGVALDMYVDGGDAPELTVEAHATRPLVFSAGSTHQVQWRGGAIQGQAEIAVPQTGTRTLTIWGSGSSYSLH